MSMDPAQKGAFAFLGLLAVGVAAVVGLVWWILGG